MRFIQSLLFTRCSSPGKRRRPRASTAAYGLAPGTMPKQPSIRVELTLGRSKVGGATRTSSAVLANVDVVHRVLRVAKRRRRVSPRSTRRESPTKTQPRCVVPEGTSSAEGFRGGVRIIAGRLPIRRVLSDASQHPLIRRWSDAEDFTGAKTSQSPTTDSWIVDTTSFDAKSGSSAVETESSALAKVPQTRASSRFLQERHDWSYPPRTSRTRDALRQGGF